MNSQQVAENTDPNLSPYSGWSSFDAGNYATAFMEAEGEDSVREALARLMCGAIAPGLERLSKLLALDSLYAAYGFWCVGETNAATECIDRSQEQDDQRHSFRSAIQAKSLDVVLIAQPGSDKVEAFQAAKGFRVFAFELSPEDFGIEMSVLLARLPADADPVMVVSIDAHGAYLPRNFGSSGIPAVIWCSDHDYFLSTRYTDLDQATVVIVNSAEEQEEISKLHGGRVASFPGHESYRLSERSPGDPRNPKFDILFTGRAFVPYMTDKARYLGKMATVLPPEYEVALVDDYLGRDRYPAILDDAGYVPLYWRYKGGIQTRAIEALARGRFVISPEARNCGGLLGGPPAGYESADEYHPICSVRNILETDDERRTLYGQSGPQYPEAFRSLFWPSPAREERFLKFAYLQSLLADAPQPVATRSDTTPVELRGYDLETGVKVYTAIARANLAVPAPSAAHYNYAGSAAFYASILVQTNQDLGNMALETFALGQRAHPRSLVLAFNAARALWIFGQRAEAVALFDAIAEMDDWAYEPLSEAMLSHRVRALANMLPYGEYHRWVALGLTGDDGALMSARNLIRSSALCYLGVARSDPGPIREAALLVPDNFIAWRELALRLGENGGAATEILEAASRSIERYPPVLLQLLSAAVRAAEQLRRTEDAIGLVRRWLLLAYRTKDREIAPKKVAARSLTIARRYQAALGEWSGAMLDALDSVDDTDAEDG